MAGEAGRVWRGGEVGGGPPAGGRQKRQRPPNQTPPPPPQQPTALPSRGTVTAPPRPRRPFHPAVGDPGVGLYFTPFA